jgi:hypothetical protein
MDEIRRGTSGKREARPFEETNAFIISHARLEIS